MIMTSSYCLVILSAVIIVQSHVIREAPSVPTIFQSSSECAEASAICDSLDNASLNFKNCEEETPNHECVGATLNSIGLCFKNIVIDSDCLQKTFDVSKDKDILINCSEVNVILLES